MSGNVASDVLRGISAALGKLIKGGIEETARSASSLVLLLLHAACCYRGMSRRATTGLSACFGSLHDRVRNQTCGLGSSMRRSSFDEINAGLTALDRLMLPSVSFWLYQS